GVWHAIARAVANSVRRGNVGLVRARPTHPPERRGRHTVGPAPPGVRAGAATAPVQAPRRRRIHYAAEVWRAARDGRDVACPGGFASEASRAYRGAVVAVPPLPAGGGCHYFCGSGRPLSTELTCPPNSRS